MFRFLFFRLMAKNFINPCFTNGYDVLGGGFKNAYFLEVFRIFWQKFGKVQTF